MILQVCRQNLKLRLYAIQNFIMDELQLRDLVEGRNDWLNIQDVLRNTFKRINDVVLSNSQTIVALEASYKGFVDRQEKKVERLEKVFEQLDRKLTSVIEVP